jgi:hypothetical protein
MNVSICPAIGGKPPLYPIAFPTKEKNSPSLLTFSISNAVLEKKLATTICSAANKSPKLVVVTEKTKKKESLSNHLSKSSKRHAGRETPKMLSVASEKLAGATRNEMKRVRDSSTSYTGSETGILPAYPNEFQDDSDDEIDDVSLNLYRPTLNTSYCPILSELQQYGVYMATSVYVVAIREEVSEAIKKSNKDNPLYIPLVERAIGARVLSRLHFCIQYFIDLLVKKSSRVPIDMKNSLRYTYHKIIGEMTGFIYRAATKELPTRGEITNVQIQIVFEGFYISAIDRIEALCGVLQVFKRTKEPIAYCPGFGLLWEYEFHTPLENQRLNFIMIPWLYRRWDNPVLSDETIVKIAVKHDLDSVALANWWKNAMEVVWEPVHSEGFIKHSSEEFNRKEFLKYLRRRRRGNE